MTNSVPSGPGDFSSAVICMARATSDLSGFWGGRSGGIVQLVTNLLNYHNRQVLDTYSLQRAAITSGSPLNSADL